MQPAPKTHEMRKNNMKKLITLLLAAIMCLSLTSCVTHSNRGTTIAGYESRIAGYESMVAGYESRIAELENIIRENGKTSDIGSDNENTTPPETQPQKTEPKETRVEITTENWQDYFEIKQFLSVGREANDFGEQKSVDIRIVTLFVLKEGIEADFSWYNKANVAIQYDADYCCRDMICNPEDFTYELLDGCRHGTEEVKEKFFARGETGKLDFYYAVRRDRLDGVKVVTEAENLYCRSIISNSYCYAVENDDGLYCAVNLPCNIKITRVEGWITLIS